jgi:hypothetical protein
MRREPAGVQHRLGRPETDVGEVGVLVQNDDDDAAVA